MHKQGPQRSNERILTSRNGEKKYAARGAPVLAKSKKTKRQRFSIGDADPTVGAPTIEDAQEYESEHDEDPVGGTGGSEGHDSDVPEANDGQATSGDESDESDSGGGDEELEALNLGCCHASSRRECSKAATALQDDKFNKEYDRLMLQLYQNQALPEAEVAQANLDPSEFVSDRHVAHQLRDVAAVMCSEAEAAPAEAAETQDAGDEGSSPVAAVAPADPAARAPPFG